MITRLPLIAPAMPSRIPCLGRLITSSQKLFSLGRRTFLPHSTAADNLVVFDSTHIDEFIKTRGVVTLPKDEAAGADPPTSLEACPLKCLLFLASGSPILIVLRLQDRVSEQALATFLNVAKSRIEMAKPSQLIPLTGFPIGEIPPFGHREPLYTLVDQCVTSHSYVVFGNSMEYVLPTTELLRVANAKVASVSVAALAAAEETEEEKQRPFGGESSVQTRSDSTALPLPWVAGAQAVSLFGIIAQKRKIANLLLFLNVVPATPAQRVKPATAAFLRRVWTHPETSEPCEVQLILGKTLERRLGRGPAAELFKSLKIGQVVKVTGKPQPHSPPQGGQSQGQTRSHVVDMVVHDIEITATIAPSLYPPGVDEENEEEGEENEEEELERLKKEKKSKPFGAAEQALLDADLPYYKLPVRAENVKLVQDLAGIENMAEVLLAHRNSINIEDEEEENRYTEFDDFPLPADTASMPVLSDKARVKAARRQAALDPGTWRPKLILGLDAEWQPNFSREERNSPVSVLQIGSTTHVFLIDMLEICHNPRNRSNGAGGSGNGENNNDGFEATSAAVPLTKEQKALSNVLEAVLGDADIIKVGFGLKYDFKRLAESYPWMPCFGGIDDQDDNEKIEEKQAHEENEAENELGSTPPFSSPSQLHRSVPIRSHVDALLLARSTGDGQTSYKRLGLSAVCRLILGKAVDKSEQTSDWGTRPLTEDQMYYAAADVTCLVDVYNAIISRRPDFLAAFWMAQFSGHLTDMAALRPKLGYYSRRGRGGGEGAGGASGAALSWRANVTTRGYGSTNQVQCNTAALMRYLGQPVPDGGKLSIIRLAASQTIDTGDGTTALVEPARMPRFPRGSGVLEYSNRTYTLFVNVPSQKYPNTFTVIESEESKECFMTWWPGKGQTMAHPLIQRLLPGAAAEAAEAAKSKTLGTADPEESEETADSISSDADREDVENEQNSVEEGEEKLLSSPTVLLFVRPQRDDYACFGRLEVSTVEELDGQLCVSWKLLDYSELESSEPFQHVLKLQKT